MQTLEEVLNEVSDEQTMHLEVAPDLACFVLVREALLDLCEGFARVKDVILALDEAFANVCAYSGATEVEFDMDYVDGRCVVTMTDDGVAFDPLEVSEELPDFDDMPGGGMGIILMKQVADEILYRRLEDRNVLTMWFT